MNLHAPGGLNVLPDHQESELYQEVVSNQLWQLCSSTTENYRSPCIRIICRKYKHVHRILNPQFLNNKVKTTALLLTRATSFQYGVEERKTCQSTYIIKLKDICSLISYAYACTTGKSPSVSINNVTKLIHLPSFFWNAVLHSFGKFMQLPSLVWMLRGQLHRHFSNLFDEIPKKNRGPRNSLRTLICHPMLLNVPKLVRSCTASHPSYCKNWRNDLKSEEERSKFKLYLIGVVPTTRAEPWEWR